MAAPSEHELTQDQILHRLTALLLQVGNIPRSAPQPPRPVANILTNTEADWRDGVIYGIAMSAAVAGGAGLNGPTAADELASAGLSLARSVQFQWTDQ